MRLERSKNFVQNLKWGLVYRFSGILIPFICRAAIIRIFGINYLGLNSLFTSIITTLNLAELGFGSAVVFFMYREIATENSEKICALLNYYKRVYRTIGMIVLVAGIALMPFLKFLIKKDVPTDINIYVIYLITLFATVISYFLFAYKNSILTAFQQESVLYKIRALVLVTESLLQIVTIFVFKDYYAYLLVTVAAAAANNLMANHYVRKYYPQYDPHGKLSKEERREISKKIEGLLFYKVGGVVFNSSGSIVISACLGLNISGMYGNYYYVLNLLFGMLAVYYTSFRAGLGNSFETETVEKNYNTFQQLQFMQSWIIGFCTVCSLCLYQDFIAVYAGPENLLDMGLVICMCLYLYIWKIQDVVHVYKEACGYWTKDRFRPLVGALINLALSFALVPFLGIHGIVIPIILVSLFVDLIWAPKAFFAEYLKKSRKEYYRLLLLGLLDLAVMLVPTYVICVFINTDSYWLNLLFKLMVCGIVPNVMFVLKNLRKRELATIKRHLIGMLRKR